MTLVLDRETPLSETVLQSWLPRRRWGAWLSRLLPLGVILVVQVVYALTELNGPIWGDEGLYAYAGHVEIGQHITNSFPAASFGWGGYFSGAPQLYPVLSGALDSTGGIAATRFFSTLCILAVTVCVYVMAARLFGDREAIWAAAIYAVAGSSIFLLHFATYDAPALLLLILPTTLMSTRQSRKVAVAAGLMLALAVAVKYASLLWVPSALVIPVLVHRTRSALCRTVLTVAVTVTTIVVGLTIWGHLLWQGVKYTTLSRHVLFPAGVNQLLGIVVLGVGFSGLIVVGGLVALWDTRRHRALGAVMVITLLLAPLHQIQIGEATSLYKHEDFGLAFAAPLAGVAMVWLFRHVHMFIVLILLVTCSVWSVDQGNRTAHYTNTRPNEVARTLSLLKPGETIMSSEATALEYYYYKDDHDKYGLLGWEFPPERATLQDTPSLIVINNVPSGNAKADAVSKKLVASIERDPEYRLVSSVPINPLYKPYRWFTWERIGR